MVEDANDKAPGAYVRANKLAQSLGVPLKQANKDCAWSKEYRFDGYDSAYIKPSSVKSKTLTVVANPKGTTISHRPALTETGRRELRLKPVNLASFLCRLCGRRPLL